LAKGAISLANLNFLSSLYGVKWPFPKIGLDDLKKCLEYLPDSSEKGVFASLFFVSQQLHPKCCESGTCAFPYLDLLEMKGGLKQKMPIG
jgi:hypothetical protein